MTKLSDWVTNHDVDVRTRTNLLLHEIEHLLSTGQVSHPEPFRKVFQWTYLTKKHDKVANTKAARAYFEGAAAVCRYILRVGM